MATAAPVLWVLLACDVRKVICKIWMDLGTGHYLSPGGGGAEDLGGGSDGYLKNLGGDQP